MNAIFKTATARRIFGASVFGCAGICVLLRVLSLFFFYDSDIGYFSRGAVLPIILYTVLALASVALITFCFIPKISISIDNFGESKIANYLYALPAMATAYIAVSIALLLSQYSKIALAAPKLITACIIFAIPALIFFVLSVIRPKGNIFAIFAFLAMIWLTLLLAASYFNLNVQMNSPNKTFSAFSLTSLVLFLSSEARLVLPIRKPHIRLFSTSCALIFVSVSAIPNFIAHFSGAFGNSYSIGIDDIISIAFLFPVCARLISMCFSKRDGNSSAETESDTDKTENAENSEESNIF